MLNRTHAKLSSKTYRHKVFIDASCVVITFICVYAISSYLNISDNYYLWARQYEKSLDIDELLPAMLASLIALLWFTKRRINESSLLIKNNHFLLHRILEVQESERKRIARDLHDDLGQYLSAIKAQAASLLVELDLSLIHISYCLPLILYVIGLPMMPEANLRLHTTLPDLRSTARKSPPNEP